MKMLEALIIGEDLTEINQERSALFKDIVKLHILMICTHHWYSTYITNVPIYILVENKWTIAKGFIIHNIDSDVNCNTHYSKFMARFPNNASKTCPLLKEFEGTKGAEIRMLRI